MLILMYSKCLVKWGPRLESCQFFSPYSLIHKLFSEYQKNILHSHFSNILKPSNTLP
ncbi:hypothetical protein Hanom_Chr04g00384241 [Helianthus anomalus]